MLHVHTMAICKTRSIHLLHRLAAVSIHHPMPLPTVALTLRMSRRWRSCTSGRHRRRESSDPSGGLTPL